MLHCTEYGVLYIKIHVSQTSPSIPEEVVILAYISDTISRHPIWPTRQSYNFCSTVSFDCIGALVLQVSATKT